MTQDTEPITADSAAQQDEILSALIPEGGAATAEFKTDDAGKTKGTATAVDAPLRAGQRVSINRSPLLNNVIVGKAGASIFTIALKLVEVNRYRVEAYGRGPGDTSLFFLWFTDEGGSPHPLWVNPTKLMHEVEYTSSKPDITKIHWFSR